MKKAIIFGASGLVGSHVLDLLLEHPAYDRVTIVVRKDTGKKHPKLVTLIGDYNSLPALKEQLTGDELYLALGTTKEKTPDKQLYYQVDHDYPVLAASIAKENGVKSVFLVSAVGSNVKSGVFYVRMKGETERDLMAVGIEHTHIFRPSMIMGQRKESRPLEKFFITVFSAINPLLVGKWKIYRGISGEEIAQAMVNAAQRPSEKVQLYHWAEMMALVRQG